jgi:hypothetical protein
MKGHCDCEEVCYQVIDKPLIVHCCHCRWCQRETGSAFALNAFIETKSVKLTKGTLEALDVPSESGKGQRIHRCPRCKVTLWSNYLGLGLDFSFVRVGTLDDPDHCPPEVHIYTETKQAWVNIDDGLPVYTQYYHRSEAWSKDSMVRFRALLDARG